MTYTLEKISPCDGGFSVTVLLSEDGKKPRRLSFPVPAEDYREAGSPKAAQELFPEDFAILRKSGEEHDAVEAAYRILGYADNSENALYRKLLSRGFSKTAAAHAVRYMTEHGYLREKEQLLRFLTDTVEKKHCGQKKLLIAAASRGYRVSDAENALRMLTEKGEIEWEREKALCLAGFSGTAEEKRNILIKNGFLPADLPDDN